MDSLTQQGGYVADKGETDKVVLDHLVKELDTKGMLKVGEFRKLAVEHLLHKV